MVQETAPNDWSINFLTHDLHVFQKEKSCIAEYTMNIDILVKKVCSSYQKGQVIPRLTNSSSSVDINMLPDLHKSFLMMIPVYAKPVSHVRQSDEFWQMSDAQPLQNSI